MRCRGFAAQATLCGNSPLSLYLFPCRRTNKYNPAVCKRTANRTIWRNNQSTTKRSRKLKLLRTGAIEPCSRTPNALAVQSPRPLGAGAFSLTGSVGQPTSPSCRSCCNGCGIESHSQRLALGGSSMLIPPMVDNAGPGQRCDGQDHPRAIDHQPESVRSLGSPMQKGHLMRPRCSTSAAIQCRFADQIPVKPTPSIGGWPIEPDGASEESHREQQTWRHVAKELDATAARRRRLLGRTPPQNAVIATMLTPAASARATTNSISTNA
jgi:hypothetical protein